jgi:hypothetical protein
MAVKLFAVTAQEAGGGDPGGERPGAVGVPGLHPEQVPEPGASSRAVGDAGPGSSGGPDPRQAARPQGNVMAGPVGCVVQLAGMWEDMAAQSILSGRHAE